MRKRALILLTALTGLALLTGCGNGDPTSSGDGATKQPSPSASATKAADFNQADVAFAQGMIPHHRQAVEMADLAPARAESQQVKDLATQIKAAQDPEIQTMSGWLKSWGEDVPEDMSGTDHGGMDMGDDMPGMMSEEDMKKLEAAKGAEFDAMFMQMMIEHHNGAIEMAKTEQSDGQNADAKALAKTIEQAQTAEIATMRKLLGQG